MTKKTTKKTATKPPYKFKKGDKVMEIQRDYFKENEKLIIIKEPYSGMPRCKSVDTGREFWISKDNLKLIIAPRTVLTIKTSKGCAKIIKTESGFHVQSKANNNEITQHSQVLDAKQTGVENILATFDLYNSAEMRAWAKEVKRKMKKPVNKKT